MELFNYVQVISQAMLQVFFLGLIGFGLVRGKILTPDGLSGLTNFFINVVFPALIFWQIVTKFSFKLYPNWWVFTLLSFVISALGLSLGYLFSADFKDKRVKKEFICLAGFQNSGYLPLVLLGWIVPKENLSTILIYLFLFLLGFNLLIWSWGVYFLSGYKSKKFALGSVFSPPVAAMLAGFILVAIKVNTWLPQWVLSPIEMLGNCSFPLAIVVVGASLAELAAAKQVMDKKSIARLILLKLIVLPVLGLLLLAYIKLPYFVGLLIILELAVPSATNLAIIARNYSQEDKLISQGIFFTHILSLVTLPLFLAAFNFIVGK